MNDGSPKLDSGPRKAPDLAMLARRHRDRMVSRARQLLGSVEEAEDVAQEALLKASDSAIRDGGAAEAWLMRVTVRLAVDRLRRRVTERAALELREREAAGVRSLAQDVDVRAAVEALDEPYRSAVVLRYLEGRTFAEVADALDTIERTARTWTGRGLEKLRKKLAR